MITASFEITTCSSDSGQVEDDRVLRFSKCLRTGHDMHNHILSVKHDTKMKIAAQWKDCHQRFISSQILLTHSLTFDASIFVSKLKGREVE